MKPKKTDRPVYIHESISLTNELKQVRKQLRLARQDRQCLLDTLVAIIHRRQGVYDSWQLEQFGPLSTDMATDMMKIAKLTYNKIATQA